MSLLRSASGGQASTRMTKEIRTRRDDNVKSVIKYPHGIRMVTPERAPEGVVFVFKTPCHPEELGGYLTT